MKGRFDYKTNYSQKLLCLRFTLVHKTEAKKTI